MGISNNKGYVGGITEADLGDNWVIDDITGLKIKASDAVHGEGLEQGLIMHKDVKSELNEQLFLKPRTDQQIPVIIRERPEDNFQ